VSLRDKGMGAFLKDFGPYLTKRSRVRPYTYSLSLGLRAPYRLKAGLHASIQYSVSSQFDCILREIFDRLHQVHDESRGGGAVDDAVVVG